MSDPERSCCCLEPLAIVTAIIAAGVAIGGILWLERFLNDLLLPGEGMFSRTKKR